MFIQLVQANSPAALAGLRFGDQVLQINGQNAAGWSTDKAHKALKAAAETRIELIVRDRYVRASECESAWVIGKTICYLGTHTRDADDLKWNWKLRNLYKEIIC